MTHDAPTPLPSPTPSPTVGVVFITHTAKPHLTQCLPPIVNAGIKPRVLVVNSSSNDGTVEEAQRLGAETLVIPRKSFNHGATREMARKHLGTDIVVMMTPDAYALDDTALEKLIAPIVQGEASIAYGKQIPHQGAGLFESFTRDFSFPKESHERSLDDLAEYGVYLFYNSDAFAAYRSAALDEIDGFRPVLSHEDALAAAMLLRKGHRIAYVAEAVVHHSHSYSLWQEFTRLFDAGLARKEDAAEYNFGGKHEGLGGKYAKALFKLVLKKKPWLVPYAFAHLGTKYLGFKIGQASYRAPLWWKKKLSGQDFYWVSDAYAEKTSAADDAPNQ